MSITLCGSGTQVTVPEKGCNDCGTVADNLKEFETKVEEEYYDKVEVNDLLSAIKTATIQVVDELPNPGETNIIYLVPKTAAETASEDETSDIYNEYVYVNGKYEYIGSTEVPQYWTINAGGLLAPTNNETIAARNAVFGGTLDISEDGIKNTVTDGLILSSGYLYLSGYDTSTEITSEKELSYGIKLTNTDGSTGSSAKTEILTDKSLPTSYSEAVTHTYTKGNNLVYSQSASNIDFLKLLGYFANTGEFLQYTGHERNQFAWTSLNIPSVKKYGGWLSQYTWIESTLNGKALYTNAITIDEAPSEPNTIICQPSVESTETFTHSASLYYANGVGYLSTETNKIHFYASSVPADDIYVEITVIEYADEVMTTSVSDEELELLGELKPVAEETTGGTTESTDDGTATTSDTSEEREV